MSFFRSVGVISGFTLLSRIFGFVRDMILARVLGAGLAADCFNLAFKLPNVFRRLFAEGAFSAGFIPLYNRHYKSDGEEGAQHFASEALAMFFPIMLTFTLLLELVMPGFVWLMNAGGAFQKIPGKFELAVDLTRITFPYLMLISLATLFSGILNSLSRFAMAAAAPILLNVALIAAMLLYYREGEIVTAYAMAWAIAFAGVIQLLLLYINCRNIGLRFAVFRPRLTENVRELGRVILPSALSAGIYNISQLVDLFFASLLPQGSISYLNYADRLNQFILGVVGIALGTALLPRLSRHIAQGQDKQAAELQNRSCEFSMLIAIPGSFALASCAYPIAEAIYGGDLLKAYDVQWIAWTVMGLVSGLPAYMLVKLLVPGFLSRLDMYTPLKVSMVALVVNVILNLALYKTLKIAGLALATAISAWINCLILSVILKRRDYFSYDRRFWSNVSKMFVAGCMMLVVLYVVKNTFNTWLGSNWFGGIWQQRVIAILVLVLSGVVSYFGACIALGAVTIADVKKRLAIGS